MTRLSIVIPVLNEGESLENTLHAVRGAAPAAEIVVVDGGSADDTVAIARRLADQLVASRRGRALQMNAGAAAASGDVLLFLHADTMLPERAESQIIETLGDPRTKSVWGRFDVTIEGRAGILRPVGAMMNLRSRLTGVATGDQGMFMTRKALDAAGGFPPIAIMEDVAMSKRLRRQSRPACLRSRVKTSGRRWEANGPVRTICTMWAMRLLHVLRVPPHRLAAIYGRLKAR